MALTLLGVGAPGELPRLLVTATAADTSRVPSWFADLSRVFAGVCVAVMVCAGKRGARAAWRLDVLRPSPHDDLATYRVAMSGTEGADAETREEASDAVLREASAFVCAALVAEGSTECGLATRRRVAVLRWLIEKAGAGARAQQDQLESGSLDVHRKVGLGAPPHGTRAQANRGWPVHHPSTIHA
jgi:hypothetical protein